MIKDIKLIAEKELIQILSRKLFFSFLLFFIIFAGYLNFLSLNIYTGISSGITLSPQLIMSADPNQGIFAPLFSNFFFLFLFLFPLLSGTAVSKEKENGTWELMRLRFSSAEIMTGKLTAYFLLSAVLFFSAFLLSVPYLFTHGYIDIFFMIHVFFGFFCLSLFWLSLSLYISSRSHSHTVFFVIMLINILLLGLDFITEIIHVPFLDILNQYNPYVFYNTLLSGILVLKIHLFYLIMTLLFSVLTICPPRKIRLVLYSIILIFLLSLPFIRSQYDMTFNKTNSLSQNSITLLNTVKDKDIRVNLYIKERGAKWQSAEDLIKLYKRRFRNIHFQFQDPEVNHKEYGLAEFLYHKRKTETLSIDEETFTACLYYAAAGKKLKIDTKKREIGYPYLFTKSKKIFYILWIFFLISIIFYSRFIILKKGAGL